MSRKNAKIVVLHDMQSRYSDFVLTKKDCDMICKALIEKYEWKEIKSIYTYLKKLCRI